MRPGARGIRRDRQDDHLAGRRRSRRRVAATASSRVAVRNRRPGCPTRRSAISSATPRMPSTRGCRPRSARPSTRPCCEPRRPVARSISGPSRSRPPTPCAISPPMRPWSSRSTTSSGSTGRRPGSLSFVLRRVADERIGVLVSIRQGSGSTGDPVDLDRALTRTTHLAVGPLPLEPLGRILRERTSHPLPHPDLARLHRITGGNPLFAIEMARAASSDGLRADPDGVWAVPEDLQQLLSSRLAALPASAARAPARDRRHVAAHVGAGARDRRHRASGPWRPSPEPRVPASSSGRVAGCGSRIPCWRRRST